MILLANEAIKKAADGTYYFRANLGYAPNGKQIQKYKSGFKTKKEAREAYSKLMLMPIINKEEDMYFKDFIQDIFLDWYKSQVKERTYETRVFSMKKH